MGDRNPAAFEFMMTGLVELRTRGAEVCAFNDGLGVIEQQVSNNVVLGGPKSKFVNGKTSCSVRSVEGNRTKSRDAASVSVHPPISQGLEASCPNGDGYNSDFSEAASSLMANVEQQLLAPERKNKRGRQPLAVIKLLMTKAAPRVLGSVPSAGAKVTKPALALIEVISPERKGRWPHAANVGFQGTEG